MNMPDEHNTRDDADKITSRILDAVNSLGDYANLRTWTERAAAVRENVSGAIDARDAALRDAREAGAASAWYEMRLWQEAKYKEMRTLSETNGIAGARMTAHRESAEYCRAREMKQQESEHNASAEHAQPTMPAEKDIVLPPSLAAKPNIPFEKQTLDQLIAERDYWAAKVARATGWGAGLKAADDFRRACETWIKRRLIKGGEHAQYEPAKGEDR